MKNLWLTSAIVLGLLLCVLLPLPLAHAEQPASQRPVVMVHGFGSNWQAWEQYLGPDGYLASAGLQGFAVGDGQVEGTLNTGDTLEPHQRTNTIAENAEILGEYIQNVKAETGAEQVDLIAHSMGGLISRYYVDRVMEGREVAQLLMLGSPQRGTDCANLPAAAGLLLPATLELRPSYVVNLFNSQITHRHGVPFYVLAGTRVEDPVQSPCAAVPSDIVISEQSATGITATVTEMPVLHTDLNTSEQVFQEFVKPLVLRPTEEIPTEPDPAAPGEQTEPLQFSRVYTGHIESGEPQTRTINIDEVTVASFALFDPTRSLTVTVRGATGNIIALSPITHGLTVIDDPETLLYLGYGFNNPKPGPWRVTLQATEETPAEGADYALTAQYQGGARVEAQSSTLVPLPGEAVTLTARLALAGEPLPIETATARIRAPDGEREQVPLQQQGESQYSGTWRPAQPGVHGIDITVQGRETYGPLVERSAFLAVEVQPTESQAQTRLVGVGATIAVLVGLAVLGILWRRRRQSAE